MRRGVVLSTIALLAIVSFAAAASPAWFSIQGVVGNYRVVQGKVQGSLAQAYYDADVQPTGWATLGLYSRPQGIADVNRANAAGYLEGTYLFGALCDRFALFSLSKFLFHPFRVHSLANIHFRARYSPVAPQKKFVGRLFDFNAPLGLLFPPFSDRQVCLLRFATLC